MAVFLADPATHGGAETCRIDTHTAAIILAGDCAWKLRRPVDYGWLDYASLEKRRIAAERELRDNARSAPGLYIGLGGISGAAGRFTLHAPGTAPNDTEPLVVMHRFSQVDLFDRMAESGRLDARLMHQTGQAVAEMHKAAPPCGYRARLPAFARKEVNDLTALAATLDAGLIARVASLIRDRALALSDLAETRHGYRCHGDLHLRNIVLWQGRPAPFDCIDFNYAFTNIDPLYDLAFLLMDLDHRGHPELATACLNAWHERLSAEPGARVGVAFDGLGLLPFYKACRAAIRGKVMGMALQGTDPAAHASEIAEANSYLRLAERYLKTTPAPRLIAVGGLSGSGKSTLARAIAAQTPALILRSDGIRKGFFGAEETERLPPRAYSAEVSAQVYTTILDRAARALDGGMTVILDAAHLRAGERTKAEVCARTRGLPFHGLWLEAPAALLQDRVTTRTGDVSDATTEVVARQQSYDLGPITWPCLSAEVGLDTLTQEALALIGAPR